MPPAPSTITVRPRRRHPKAAPTEWWCASCYGWTVAAGTRCSQCRAQYRCAGCGGTVDLDGSCIADGCPEAVETVEARA